MSDLLVNKELVELLQFKDGDSILEFGVATGNTLSAMIENLIQKKYTNCKIFGFDSFRGLPADAPSITTNMPDWVPGAFNIVDELHNKNRVATVEDGITYVNNRLQTYNLDTQLIVGEYKDTLNSSICTQYNIPQACYVHIDCDIYLSALQVLEFLVQNNLMKNRCIVRYDDWVVSPSLQGQIGEEKAHNEIKDKYNLRFEKINTTLGTMSAVFRFLS